MLDKDTRSKIDSARDILVGKVPDPTEQVNQITIALIYKFMDDMDQESKAVGGNFKFFTGEFKKFAWPKIIDKKLSGQERLDLYIQALSQIPKNDKLPPLFRKIFKNAFLPYRDSETLNLFLKEIDHFSYDHSENLGNAFEYLLSILGSQGDAGQFRTPRHIIDFIVEVIDPKKDELILDPACGTGGFLISAYKHIIKHNSNNYDPKKTIYSFAGQANFAEAVQIQSNGLYRGDKLTPSEKRNLQKNIIGYDISPKMVKLSLVNMYLHRFKKPKIFEYDTLTSVDRWGDDFSVILANPPFMSPTGGIRPHNRFSIQANRSEVLFVDYIAEHLTINGRAGVIVPEGIIFKNDRAYKALRKRLVEDRLLWAVVSLPAGVFQPYSGVKTSILFLDKKRAKTTQEILFVNVENDGYDLGATRRWIEKNDLPEAFQVLKAWNDGKGVALSRFSTSKVDKKLKNSNQTSINSRIAHQVSRSEIAKGGDYNLTGSRYKVIKAKSTKWPMVELGSVVTLEYGKPLKKENRKGGSYPVFGSNGIVGYHDQYLVPGPCIIVGRKGTAGAVTYSDKNGYPIDTALYVQIKQKNIVHLKFLYFIMRTLELGQINKQAGVPGLNRNDAYKLKIPLPPLEVQREVVAEIEQERMQVESCKKLIKLHEAKIHQKITSVWKQK